jgi:Sulfotransferase domain
VPLSSPKWRHNHWPARSVENFVISFPKSGRTWLRVMMAVAESQARGVTSQEVVAEWLAEEAPRLAGSPLLFTHALSVPAHEPARGMDLFLEYIQDRRRLFFVRDPRDVVVSHYFQVSRRARRQKGYDPGSIGDFVRDPDRGLDRVLLFFAACERSLRSGPGPTLLLAYEDLHSDPTAGLAAALAFFGTQTSPAVLKLAVEFARFENMRRLEREGEFAHDNRRLVARDPSDPESFKTRRGEVGSYEEYLSADEVAYVEERVAALMPESFGYRKPGVAPTTLAVSAPG